MIINLLGDEDSLLLERIQLGEEPAITLLYDRYSPIVYSIALRVLQDPSLAEEVLSDIFIEVWRRPSCFIRAKGNLFLSLVMIARNRAVAMLHHKPARDIERAVPDWVANHNAFEMPREGGWAEIDKISAERWKTLESVFFAGATETNPVNVGTDRSQARNEMIASTAVARLAGTGLEVIDLESDPAFARRKLHARDTVMHLQGMNRLARIFEGNPTAILQELVTAAVELCGADSAGISLVQNESTEENFYRWVATAGQYSGFLNAKLPRYPSACGVTLERGRPQVFRVAQRFFDLMGVQAPTVTDGLLLPWQVEETRGTIWIMAHGRKEAFDGEDCQMMQVLANFAATGVRMQQQQKLLIDQARAAGEAAMAHSLAHQINNPLQGLAQIVYLLGKERPEPNVFAKQAMEELMRLSDLVKQQLSNRGAGLLGISTQFENGAQESEGRRC